MPRNAFAFLAGDSADGHLRAAVMLGLAALSVSTALMGCQPAEPLPQHEPARSSERTSTAPEGTAFPTPPMVVQTAVVRVVDGDTIVVRAVAGEHQPTNGSGAQHTVRLLGIDTPEMNSGKGVAECGAQAATDRLEELLPADTTVTLTYDTHADRTDRYGRSLAYVTVVSSGEDANRAMVAEGYAVAWIPKGEPQPER